MRVTALAGGTGAAKLLRGLVSVVDPLSLTVIGNTGDDSEIWGLHVSPDLDTVLYALAGQLDVERGWGLSSESFRCLARMADLGEPAWFQIGDRDLATHLIRTRALGAGVPLSEVTRELAQRLGVPARVLPMSDDPVRTRLRTAGGWLAFQEYFVRERTNVDVLEVAFAGADGARAAPGVLAAIREADLVLVCPSNPVTSLGPILAVPGVLSALAARASRNVAVSPIVGRSAVSGPAGDLMRVQGLPVSALGVARAYAPWLHVLVVDEVDRELAGSLEDEGVHALVASTMMTSREREVALAREIVARV